MTNKKLISEDTAKGLVSGRLIYQNNTYICIGIRSTWRNVCNVPFRSDPIDWNTLKDSQRAFIY